MKTMSSSHDVDVLETRLTLGRQGTDSGTELVKGKTVSMFRSADLAVSLAVSQCDSAWSHYEFIIIFVFDPFPPEPP